MKRFSVFSAAFVDHDVVAQQPHLGPAAHDAFGHAAAGDLADPGDVEHLADLGVAEELLAHVRREQAGQRAFMSSIRL